MFVPPVSRRTLGALVVTVALATAACGSTSTTSGGASPASGAPSAAPQAALEQLSGVSTTVALDSGTAAVLAANNVTVVPIAPATASTSGGAVTVAFPITDGFVSLYDPSQLRFIRRSLSHSGGLTFSAGGKSLSATDFVVNPGTSILTATVGGAVVPLLDLNGSQVAVTTDTQGRIHLDGTVAVLSTEAAAARGRDPVQAHPPPR